MAGATNMTSGRPLVLIARFSLPILCGSVLQFGYMIVDSIVVGRLIGIDAFAAVGASGFLYWLVLSIVNGMASGFLAIFAQHFGSGDASALRKSFAMSVALAVVIGAALSVCCVIGARPMLSLLNTPERIIDDTAIYLQILTGGMIITFLYNVFRSLFYALGDSKSPLIAVIIASIVNIALDIGLVLSTPYGVAAVAAATIIAQLAACAFCAWRIGAALRIRLRPEDWRPDRTAVMALLRVGVPMGARDCISAVAALFVQYAVNGYGIAYIAGVDLAKKLYGILFLIGEGIEGATCTYVAQNFGAGHRERIAQGMLVARRAMLISVACITAATFPFGRRILGLFIAGEAGQINAVLDIAVRQLNVILLGLPAYYLLLLYRAGLRGLGNAVMPMASGFIEAGARLIAIFTLPLLIGEWGVYIAEAVGWPFMAMQLWIGYALLQRKGTAAPILARQSP